jgi:Pvc16 N-terminal domain
MSSPLAIASVTAVLRDLLNNGLVDHNITGAVGSNVTVTAVPPDTIAIDDTNAKTQLNIFLHQVTPNPGWRNVELPSRDPRGERRTNSPLALDLHYLITAYGAAELHSEILLGYAMYLLHERPVLDREAIRVALAGGTVDNSILPPAYQALSTVNLADQVEQIKITPVTMNTEEMSKLWSAMQANYRPTAAYSLSVVLIESEKATRLPLPVLTRGPRDPVTAREAGIVATAALIPPYPGLTAVVLPENQLAAVLGDTIVLQGHHLDGSNLEAFFEHSLLDSPITMPLGVNVNSEQVSVTLPSNAAANSGWPPGGWTVSLSLQRPGETKIRTTNRYPVMLAPSLDIPNSSSSRDAGSGAVTIQLAFSPEVRPTQQVSLNAGGHETLPTNLSVQTGSLGFLFPTLPQGSQWIRLRIDGVDSLLVDRSEQPPQFKASEQMVIPS